MKKILIPIKHGFSRSVLATCRTIGTFFEIHILSGNNRLKRFQRLLKSKYCYKYGFCPDPMLKPQEFIKFVKEYAEDNYIDIIFPFTDSVASLLSYYKNEFQVKIPLPSYDIFKKAIDKFEIIKIAENLNIPVPNTTELFNIKKIDRILSENNIKYPFVLKPKVRGDQISGTQIIKSKDELKKIYQYFIKIGRKDPIYNYEKPIIQEFIPSGMIYDCCTLTSNGKVNYALTQCRYRQMNPRRGIGVVNLTSKNIELINLSKKLLELINYHGPAQLEWLKTKSNKFILLEINPRFWGTLELSIKAGYNFPLYVIKALYKKLDKFYNLPYKIGLKERWIFPYEFISILKDRGKITERLREYANIIELFRNDTISNINLSDPNPHIFDFLFLMSSISNFFHRG